MFSCRRWSLILCATCGSHGTHRDCSFLRSNNKKWECEECAPSAEATGGTEGGSGLRSAVGVPGLVVPGKGGGHATRMETLIREGEWLGRGLRICAWERQKAEFSCHLSFTTYLQTQVTSPAAAAPSTVGGISAETPAWNRIRAILGLIGQDLPY